MMRSWRNRLIKDRSMDKRRKIKLLTKAQKAGVLDCMDEIKRLDSWNRRFGMVARLRSQR